MNNWIGFQFSTKQSSSRGVSRQIGCPRLVLLVLTTMKIISVIKSVVCNISFVRIVNLISGFLLIFSVRLLTVFRRMFQQPRVKLFLQSLLIRFESNNFVLPVKNHSFVCVIINNKQNIPVIVYYCLKFDVYCFCFLCIEQKNKIRSVKTNPN